MRTDTPLSPSDGPCTCLLMCSGRFWGIKRSLSRPDERRPTRCLQRLCVPVPHGAWVYRAGGAIGIAIGFALPCRLLSPSLAHPATLTRPTASLPAAKPHRLVVRHSLPGFASRPQITALGTAKDAGVALFGLAAGFAFDHLPAWATIAARHAPHLPICLQSAWPLPSLPPVSGLAPACRSSATAAARYRARNACVSASGASPFLRRTACTKPKTRCALCSAWTDTKCGEHLCSPCSRRPPPPPLPPGCRLFSLLRRPSPWLSSRLLSKHNTSSPRQMNYPGNVLAWLLGFSRNEARGCFPSARGAAPSAT